MLIRNNKTTFLFGGGSTFQQNPNSGLGPKNITVLTPYGNFMSDAGGEFLSWPRNMAKWIKKAYRHMAVTPDFSTLDGHKIDFLKLTHSHFDHVMASPLLELYFRSRESKIYGSPQTLEIIRKVFMDTLNHSPYVYNPIQGILGVLDSLSRREVLPLGRKEILHGIELYTRITGHIMGATYDVYKIKNGPTIMDTGDMALFNQPLVPGSTILQDIKNGEIPLPNIIIGTDFTNPSLDEFNWQEASDSFRPRIRHHLENGKTIIIGAFENSRTQNVAEELREYITELGYGHVYIDGGGRDVYDIYKKYSSWCPLYPEVSLEGIKYVQSADHRQTLIEDPTPKVIITTSGMFDGGPMEAYLEHGLDDPRFVFFTTSYVAPKSKAAKLIAATRDTDEPTVKFEDRTVKVRAKIEKAHFTAHGNLLDFVKIVRAIYDKNGNRKIVVFMTHGMKKTKKLAAQLVKEWADCKIVEHGDIYDTDELSLQLAA